MKFAVHPELRRMATPILDPTSFAQVVMALDQLEIRSGRSYVVFDSTDDLNTTPIRFRWTTPAQTPEQRRLIHFSMFFTAIDQFALKFVEDATGSTGGTLVDYMSRNRAVSIPSLMEGEIYKDATDPTGGTTLIDINYGAQGGGLSTSGNVIEERLVLKPDTVYTLAITTGLAINNNIAHLGFNWSEQVQQNIFPPTP